MSDPATDLGDPPIEHRFLGLDRRLIAPTLAILALVVFWGGFVPWLDETVEGDELEPGTVLTVAGAVELTPADGWRPDGVPLPSNATLTLFKDGVSFTLSPGAWDGTADELLDELIDEEDPLIQGDRTQFTLATGPSGVGVDTSGPEQLGILAALVSDVQFSAADDRGTGIRVEATSEVDFDSEDQQDVADMLSSIRVVPLDERMESSDEEGEG
jgi:hypothetical protein